jgi:hypothetical protein
MPDGTRIQVVGVAEDGKYGRLTEDPQAAIRGTLHQLDAGLPVEIEMRLDEIGGALFPYQMGTVSLGVMGAMGAMLSVTGIFGMAAYSVSKRLRELGIRVALGAQRKECYRLRWDGLSNCWPMARRQDCSSEFWRHGCWL